MNLCLITLLFHAMSIVSSTSECNVTVVVGSSSHHNFTAGLFWDYDNAVLLYVDRVRREIHRLNTCTGEDQFITLGKMPSFVIPTKGFDHRFIISENNEFVYLFWPFDTESGYYAECLIATVDFTYQGHRLSGAMADAYGRVWSSTFPLPDSNGSYPKDQGSLYRLDTRTPGKADVVAVIRPISLINDQTWTRDRHIFYTSEGDTGCICSYKFDLVNGIICCGQTVFCLSDFNITGTPGGLAIDWNDDLWIAVIGGGLVLNVNPNTKQLIRSVVIPVKYVTDVAFGGANLEILYVTSKDVGDPTDSKEAGSLFQVTGLGVFGIRINYAVMNSDCTPEFFN